MVQSLLAQKTHFFRCWVGDYDNWTVGYSAILKCRPSATSAVPKGLAKWTVINSVRGRTIRIYPGPSLKQQQQSPSYISIYSHFWMTLMQRDNRVDSGSIKSGHSYITPASSLRSTFLSEPERIFALNQQRFDMPSLGSHEELGRRWLAASAAAEHEVQTSAKRLRGHCNMWTSFVVYFLFFLSHLRARAARSDDIRRHAGHVISIARTSSTIIQFVRCFLYSCMYVFIYLCGLIRLNQHIICWYVHLFRLRHGQV